MFEGLKARLDRFLAENTAPADRRAEAGALREAMVEARVAVRTMQQALLNTERELEAERRQADDAERRGRLAASIEDAETVTLAERYAARHRERVALLERKLVVLREELAMAERELADMATHVRGAPRVASSDSIRDAWNELEAAGQSRPGTDPADSLLEAQLDQARRKQAVEDQLAYLKKKMGRE